VSLREPSNERIAREVEALLSTGADQGGWLLSRGDSGIGTPIVAFVCGERAEGALREYGRRAAAGGDVEYPPILPVDVNCADTVGESHVAHALACGADGVAILGCGCDCRHSGVDPKEELVERLNRATRDLGMGERVGFFAPEIGDPEGFVDSLSEFEGSLDPSPVPEGDHRAEGTLLHSDHENPEFYNHGWTLESVRAILEYAEPEREVIRGLTDFGRMEVNDACTLTPTCSNLCPTDAIRRTEGGLEFNHEKCVNCGLCEEGCPESAITMHDGLDLSLLPENREPEPEIEDGDPAWTRTFEGEMLGCTRCGKEFTSKRSAQKIEEEVGDLVGNLAPSAEGSVFEYCSECRAHLLYDRGD
jgi:Fe-S-cluster-containing hydrogenase component 2/coenzyme F420-reducing hydrogenase delta subunit